MTIFHYQPTRIDADLRLSSPFHASNAHGEQPIRQRALTQCAECRRRPSCRARYCRRISLADAADDAGDFDFSRTISVKAPAARVFRRRRLYQLRLIAR